MTTRDSTKLDQAPLTSRVFASRRVFPASPSPDGLTTTTLSIVDATVARFAVSAAVWLYDADDFSPDTNVFFERLEASLKHTLDDYRHFAGQLRWVSSQKSVGDTPAPLRLGRPEVVYGAATDPGVELVLAHYDRALSDVVPSDEDRRGARRVWVATDFPQDEFLPSCDLAFVPQLGRFEGLPGVSVQLTAFSCGGFAVGVRMTHCLADALCLVGFVRAWAERTQRMSMRGLGGGGGWALEEGVTTRPVFDPGLLDRHAGDVSLSKPDSEKVALARSLPMHRYDWWDTDAPGYPSWATANSEATKPSVEALREMTLTPSTPPPWHTWDTAARAEVVQIRFGGDEVRRMKEAAQTSLGAAAAGADQPGVAISRLDALLAHVWLLVNRARQPALADAGPDEHVYLDVTLGLRGRVAPPLPDGFVGTPILIAHASLPAADDVGLGAAAAAIRAAVARFTPRAVGAYLHDAAREVSPQRLWQGFGGSRHLLCTSWMRTGAYAVDFGTRRGGPRYVQGRMPRMDGLLQVVDVDGVAGGDLDVSLSLEAGAMGRLLADEEALWAWGRAR